jgi:thiol:disulfide interchange protein
MPMRTIRKLRAVTAMTCMILASLTVMHCGREYTEFRVYPVPGRLTVPAGGESFIALRVEIPKTHYIYSNPKGPGIGKPTEVSVKAPGHLIFSPARFLRPEKYFSFGDTAHTWIYKNETTVFLPFSVKNDAPKKMELAITFDAQLCSSSECLLRKVIIPCEIGTTAPGGAPDPHDVSMMSLFTMAASSRGDNGEPASIAAESGPGGSSAFQGMFFEPRTLNLGVSGLLQAILFGLLAGLILNVMPCVLPVVSLKIMSFVQHAGKSGRQLRYLGILFSLGILSSFAVLASLAAFLGYSWGGLFQHRLFIIIMAAVIFSLALSMFDVYTLNIPLFAGRAARERENPYADAFMKGLLATLLATPCSGPFLGGTLAWALTQPPPVIFIIFMSVGSGMALPYLLLTLQPKLVSYIPKPGEWMITFERVMGFLLIFTVIYLVGILNRNDTLPAVTFLCFIALALWQYGRFGAIHRPLSSRILSSVLLVVIIAFGYTFSFPGQGPTATEESAVNKSFTSASLMRNRDEGKISMVVFTADWCPNCRVVERLSLHTPTVAEEMRRRGVDLMTADITRTNPPASELLEKLGGKSIPYLAVFPPKGDFRRPVCLRDIYSEEDVLKAIRMAVGE